MLARRLFLAALAGLVLALPAWTFAATGTYTSGPIGDERLTTFTSFVVHNQQIPDGAGITYSFAGSSTNYGQWSAPQAIDQSLTLSDLPELASSKYAKVRIVMTGSQGASPTLGGFTLSYEVLGESGVDAALSGGGSSQESATVNLSNTSQVATAPATLATTGGNLFVNLAAAVVLSLAIGWWLVGRRPLGQSTNTAVPPASNP